MARHTEDDFQGLSTRKLVLGDCHTEKGFQWFATWRKVFISLPRRKWILDTCHTRKIVLEARHIENVFQRFVIRQKLFRGLPHGNCCLGDCLVFRGLSRENFQKFFRNFNTTRKIVFTRLITREIQKQNISIEILPCIDNSKLSFLVRHIKLSENVVENLMISTLATNVTPLANHLIKMKNF